MTTLVESPLFDLTHDPACTCLYATWKGTHNGPVTQANYELIFWFVRLTRSKKLLNDGLLDQNGWRELHTWLAQDCFPHLAAEGLQVVAWVMPRDKEALFDTHKLLPTIHKLLVETFSDAESAYNWLHQWPKQATHRPGFL